LTAVVPENWLAVSNMPVEAETKIDNGTGGSRATKTGKPERVGEPGGESINRIIGEGKVGPMTKRLSELYAKRTATEGVEVA